MGFMPAFLRPPPSAGRGAAMMHGAVASAAHDLHAGRGRRLQTAALHRQHCVQAPTVHARRVAMESAFPSCRHGSNRGNQTAICFCLVATPAVTLPPCITARAPSSPQTVARGTPPLRTGRWRLSVSTCRHAQPDRNLSPEIPITPDIHDNSNRHGHVRIIRLPHHGMRTPKILASSIWTGYFQPANDCCAMIVSLIPAPPSAWCEFIHQKILPWLITASGQWPDEMDIPPPASALKYRLPHRHAMAMDATDEPISRLT